MVSLCKHCDELEFEILNHFSDKVDVMIINRSRDCTCGNHTLNIFFNSKQDEEEFENEVKLEKTQRVS